MSTRRVGIALTVIALLAGAGYLHLRGYLGSQAVAQESSTDNSLDKVVKPLPEELKQVASRTKNSYGKIYCLWPMSDGTFLFEVNTPSGGVAYTFKSGDHKTDGMVGVLMYAYGKQVPVWVFEDPKQPQVAASVVTVTP